jgi:hypothetical protein
MQLFNVSCKCRGCGKTNAVKISLSIKTNIGKPSIKAEKVRWKCSVCDTTQVYVGNPEA